MEGMGVRAIEAVGERAWGAHGRDARLIEETLGALRCPGVVVQVQEGPRLVRYGVLPQEGIRMRTIAGLGPDLARVLAVPLVHIWAPVLGTNLVGLDVPRREPCPVLLGDVLRPTWEGCYPPLSLALGLDAVGTPVLADLAQMPHLLVAGSTNSGKSSFLHALIGGLVLRNNPLDLRLLLVDRKGTELGAWEKAPHVAGPALLDMGQILGTLRWLNTDVIDARARRLAQAGVRDLAAYNAHRAEGTRLPVWVLVIDELGELMAAAPKPVHDALVRIAALGRAVGLHLIVATQRPSVNVVAGVIKANIPARLACRLPTGADSRTVLAQGGAEHLLGAGDALFMSQSGEIVRLQGPYLRPNDVEVICKVWHPGVSA